MPSQIGSFESRLATVDLTTGQFCAVKLTSLNNQPAITYASAGQGMLGILQDRPIAGQPGAVCTCQQLGRAYNSSVLDLF
jgi:hypothetical protein